MNRTTALDDGGFAARLAACATEDFDGHNEFADLSPEQRIQRVEQAAWFVWQCRRATARQRARARRDSQPP